MAKSFKISTFLCVFLPVFIVGGFCDIFNDYRLSNKSGKFQWAIPFSNISIKHLHFRFIFTSFKTVFTIQLFIVSKWFVSKNVSKILKHHSRNESNCTETNAATTNQSKFLYHCHQTQSFLVWSPILSRIHRSVALALPLLWYNSHESIKKHLRCSLFW